MQEIPHHNILSAPDTKARTARDSQSGALSHAFSPIWTERATQLAELNRDYTEAYRRVVCGEPAWGNGRYRGDEFDCHHDVVLLEEQYREELTDKGLVRLQPWPVFDDDDEPYDSGGVFWKAQATRPDTLRVDVVLGNLREGEHLSDGAENPTWGKHLPNMRILAGDDVQLQSEALAFAHELYERYLGVADPREAFIRRVLRVADAVGLEREALASTLADSVVGFDPIRLDQLDRIGNDGGVLRTAVDVRHEAQQIGARVRAYSKWPEQPSIDLDLDGDAFSITGDTPAGISCVIKSPTALRDLAALLLEVADKAESSGVLRPLEAVKDT